MFKNIGQLSKYFTVSASASDAALPSQRPAVREYLLPLLGPTLLAQLQTEADTNPAQPTELLDLVLNAFAPLLYYNQLPFIHTNITSTGLKNTVTDKQQIAYRYQYEDLLQNCQQLGLAGLEAVHDYLVLKQADFADWQESIAFKRLNKNIIPNGTTFSELFYLPQPHRIFNALQPVMQEVEDLYIVNAILPSTFDRLKTGNELTDDEKAVKLLIQKSVANFTIHKAAVKLAVKVLPEGITVLLSAGTDRKNSGEGNAPDLSIQQLRSDTDRDGNAYLQKALAIMNEKANDQQFTDFKKSSLYKDPSVFKKNVNDDLNIFIL